MMTFKSPDVKAPRFRPEVYNILSKEFFEKFKAKYPKYKNMDNATLKKIGKLFNQQVCNTVVETRDGIQLPEQIGWLFIGSCTVIKKENIDFAKSKKYGVKVTNKNWETDGKLAKIFFTSYAPKHKMKNREYWRFIACREFKRNVAKTYPENWNMYVQVENSKQLRLAYNKITYKNVLEKQTQKALQNYNEFDL